MLDEKAGEDEGTAVLAIVLQFVLLIPIMIWRAYVLWILYGWFLLPLGAPSIGYANLGGISLLATAATLRGVKTDDADKDMSATGKAFYAILKGLSTPAFILLSGWVWKLLM